jgi:hypothetical protein
VSLEDHETIPHWVYEQRERALEPLEAWAARKADETLRGRVQMETEEEYRTREACESEAATEAHWARAFAAKPAEDLHYPTGLDRRVFGRDAAVADGWVRDEQTQVPAFDAGGES